MSSQNPAEVQNDTNPQGAEAPARRRMAGYQPNPRLDSAGGSPEPSSGTPPPVRPASTTPARKRRMTSGPAATGPGVAEPAAPSPPPRMGSSVSAEGGRKRMGGENAGQASDRDDAASTVPSTTGHPAAEDGRAATERRTRIGSTSGPSRIGSSVRRGAGQTSTVQGAGGNGADKGVSSRPAWVKPAAIIGSLVIVALLVVLGARWLRTLEGVQEFIVTYDGHATQLTTAPEGMPRWMGWQHFFNIFLIVLIIRTGLQVRNERKPPGYWTAKEGSFFSPRSNTPKKVSLSQWLHQSLDVLWVVNGVIFVVLLIVTGHWMRIVPTDWDIIPNMVSTGIQYASLDWPTENGWVHYNALQVTTYFITVFVAAPLAIISGLRFSTWWPQNAGKLNKIYPVEWARATHFPVMLYFVGFTIVHVFLVFFTGALRNLNHMYTSRDVVDWWGLVIFLVSLVVIVAGWLLTKPMFTTPIAARMGKVSK